MLITVTLDPFGLQKWQNKKNDSTLPEKSIYTKVLQLIRQALEGV